MALTNYITQVQRLLHDSTGDLYAPQDVIAYINQARTRISAEGACIRSIVNLATQASTQTYNLSSISVASITGASYVLLIRKAAITSATAPARLDGRPWDWFFNYCICAPLAGTPTTWAQLTQGQAGQFYLWPTPVSSQILTLDAVIIPIELVDDSTVEAIPYPWTEAVQYYASYLAYMNAQRNADADRMYQLYTQRMQFARDVSTPSALPRNFPLSSQVSGIPSSTPAPFPGGQNGA